MNFAQTGFTKLLPRPSQFCLLASSGQLLCGETALALLITFQGALFVSYTREQLFTTYLLNGVLCYHYPHFKYSYFSVLLFFYDTEIPSWSFHEWLTRLNYHYTSNTETIRNKYYRNK